jgi:hypothetical protein
VKLFGAVGENSAVGAAGWDVILSGLSLGVWAASRNLDPVDIVLSVGVRTDSLFFTATEPP